MKIKFQILLLSILLLLPEMAMAQRRIFSAERSRDRIEIIVTKKQLKRDTKELTLFKTQIQVFKNAYSGGDAFKADSMQSEILVTMDREIAQSERKAAAFKAEADRSSREIATSISDERNSQWNTLGSGDNSRDRRKDLRDERRDLRDDQRDMQDDLRDLERQRQLSITQSQIRAAFFNAEIELETTGDLETANEILLLNHFQETMELDIRASRRELCEDRRELWEDRRESRERKKEIKEFRQERKARREAYGN